ncbi:MAG TPA: outer membrane beta-barrel protein [Longimicrobiales bacterium]
MGRKLLLAVSLLVLSTSTAWAQGRFAIDLSAAAAFPTEDLGDEPLKTGVGVGFTANMRVLQHLHIYGGWDYFRFTPKESVIDQDINDTGYALGAKFQHPVYRSIDSWLRLGGIYNHIEVEDDAGDLIVDSGHELGWEAGAGLSIPLSDRFALLPGARYRTYSATLSEGATEVPVDMSYVAAELRLSFIFGATPLAVVHR